MKRFRTVLVFLCSLTCTACGGGGGGSTSALPVAVETPDTSVPSASVLVASAFSLKATGGLQGTANVVRKSGDKIDYAEDIALDFTSNANLTSFNALATISPSAPWSAYLSNGGTRVGITVRKVPGTTYTLTLPATLASASGALLGTKITYKFATAAAPVPPPPLRSTPNEPYRYGVLEHPFPFSLSGPTAAAQIAAIAGAGARFARIDYTGDQIETSAGAYNFTTEDTIMDALAAAGMTEMPIIDQYSAPTWATQGNPYPSVWANPADYAAFAGAVAAHLAQKYPQVTRIEIFNEPNLNGWWQNSNPAYAATDGSATAVYMKAAYAAIKAANPRLTIVGPALAAGGGDVEPRKFLTQMYASDCKTGICWDVLSVHNYAWIDPTYPMASFNQSRWTIYKDLQAIAVANGEATPHVMLTEWSFSTYMQSNGFDPAVQALFIAKGLNLMLADPTVDGIVYTNIYSSATDFWGRTAITGTDFSHLPGYATYQAFAHF